MPTDDYIVFVEYAMGGCTVKLEESSLAIESLHNCSNIISPYCAFTDDYCLDDGHVEPWQVTDRIGDLNGFLENPPPEQFGYFFRKIDTDDVNIDNYRRQRNHEAQ